MNHRVLTVAKSEFLTLIKTKAFIIGILMMPILFGAFGFFISYAEHHVDLEDRRFAVIDHTGAFYAPLAAAAEIHNLASGRGESRTGPYFLPNAVDLGGRNLDDVKVTLSEQIRKRDLFAFVEIPTAVLDLDAVAAANVALKSDDPDSVSAKAATDKIAIRYYTETTSYEPLPDWLRTTLNEEIAKRRFTQAGVDQGLVTKLNARSAIARFSLVERAADGQISIARKVDAITTYGPPIFFLVLMFLAVMTSGQHLLNAIIEEKMSRISEVMLGSVTTFQLLMGKLIGVSAVSALLVLFYCAGAVWAVVQSGRFELLSPALIGWFVVFLLCALLMYGSIFLALGSACSSISDAQSLLQPAMMVLLLAYFGSFVVMRAPDSPLATAMSFLPTMTPFTMMLRIAMPPGAPVWQVLLSVVGLIVATGAVVWAAGKIFRVGILMQGKAPNLPELLRWIRA